MGVKPLRHLGDEEELVESSDAKQVTPELGRRSVGKQTPQKPESAARRVWLGVREIVVVVVGALVISMVLRAVVFQLFEIPSGSMENTLKPHDKIAVLKFAKFQRGDVVVFEDNANWLGAVPGRSSPRVVMEWLGLAPDSSQNHLVKRIIGMPGDTVECCAPSGNLLVNGVEINESGYLYSAGNVQARPSDFAFKVVVPADRVFVMGDHRNRSKDSRCWLQSKGIDAFVPTSRIVGPAKKIVAPLDRWKTISGETAFANVPAPGPAPAKPFIEASKVTC